MNYQYSPIEKTQIINNVFMAYFLNILDNEGINLVDYWPVFPPIINWDIYDEHFEFIKGKHIGWLLVKNRSINELDNKSIEDFMDDYIKDKLAAEAVKFAQVIKAYPGSDIVFALLPESPPYICGINKDEDTRFAARTTFGTSLKDNKEFIIFDFHAYFVHKYKNTVISPNETEWEMII